MRFDIVRMNEDETIALDSKGNEYQFHESRIFTCNECDFFDNTNNICDANFPNKEPPKCLKPTRKDRRNGIYKHIGKLKQKQPKPQPTITQEEQQLINIML